MTSEIYVVRHAETVLGDRDIVNGDPAVENPLTERGRVQAREVRRRLESVDFGLCITTEFDRTKQTADVILDGRWVPRLVMADLNDPRRAISKARRLPPMRRGWTKAG